MISSQLLISHFFYVFPSRFQEPIIFLLLIICSCFQDSKGFWVLTMFSKQRKFEKFRWKNENPLQKYWWIWHLRVPNFNKYKLDFVLQLQNSILLVNLKCVIIWMIYTCLLKKSYIPLHEEFISIYRIFFLFKCVINLA